MRTWKLVSGILSIVLSVFVLFQSCAAGMVHTLAATGENGGSGGVIVAIMLLAGGIVSIVARNGSKGGHIALVVLFGIGAVCGYAMAGTVYQDLYIWATWCLVIAVLAVVSLLKAPKNAEKHRKKSSPPVPSILRNRGLFFAITGAGSVPPAAPPSGPVPGDLLSWRPASSRSLNPARRR